MSAEPQPLKTSAYNPVTLLPIIAPEFNFCLQYYHSSSQYIVAPLQEKESESKEPPSKPGSVIIGFSLGKPGGSDSGGGGDFGCGCGGGGLGLIPVFDVDVDFAPDCEFYFAFRDLCGWGA